MINWADLIFVMEETHKKRILKKFEIDNNIQSLEVLDIPDDYKYMDKDLIEILELKLEDIFT